MYSTDSLCLLYVYYLSNNNTVVPARVVFESNEPLGRMTFTEREAKGDRLTFKIVSEYLRLGYFVVANYGHSEGVDVLVICSKEGKVKVVCECKNYAKYDRNGKAQFVATDTFHKDVDDLNQFDSLPDVEKWYIVSYSQILSYEQKQTLEKNHIKLREIGYEA